MPARPSLLGLLGLQPLAWPSHAVREHTGHVETDELPDPTMWLSALDDSVLVSAIRTGASSDRAAAEIDLGVEPGAGFLTYPGGWPFVIASMPDVEFRVQAYTAAARSCRMFVSAGDAGPEVLIEGLPVEILLPTGLVTPHPDEPGDPLGGATIVVGEFEPGRLDDLKVIYRRTEPTSIFVHLRVFVNDDLEFDLQPAVPISFGRCGLFELPCRAVHDFRLIPSPRLARDRIEWLRHSVEPLLPNHTSSYDGLFAVRTVDVDAGAEGMSDVTEFLNGHSRDQHPAAEFVLGDLVVPFHGPFWLPVPRHATVGIRRNVIDPTNTDQVYAFDRAPVHLHLSEDPKVAFNVESFFYRSLPAEDLALDLGLTFEAAVVWGDDASPNNALGVTLEPEYTILATYRRDFGADGTPLPGQTPKKETNELLHVEIAGALIVDIMGFQVGFSLGRRLGQDKSIVDSLVATFDAFVSMPPTGKDDSWFHLRGLNGEKIAFAVEGIGWRFGPHFEGLALPDGLAAHFGPVVFTISEVGLIAEQGASYLVFSGGLQIPLPSGTSGGLSVRRLRSWMSGDPSQPRRKLDGLFLRLQGPSFLAEAGGYYTSLVEQDGTAVSEYGFTGAVDFTIGPRHHRLGVDILKGERSSTTEHFGYFMFAAFYAGQIGPFGGFELRSARFLYADDMVPKLVPVAGESRELRYFRWYRESDPLTVPGDRRLAAWKPSEDSWAIGVGASASFVGFGKLVELDAFVLVVRGPEERGTLITARLFLMSNIEPLGYLAVEIDQASGRTSAVLAIDATLDKFMRNAPRWMAEAGGFTGTLFLSNDPDTVAIGRLAEQSTWLALRFDVDVFVKASLTIGFCLELVEGGPKGFGLVVRLDGLIGKKGVIALTFHAEFGAVVMIFTTGSSDYSAAVWIQAGIRFTLFGFLRIGVSARLDFRAVGARPARAELTGEIRLETPWWLPDVTWRLDAQSGTLASARLSTAVPPVRGAGATEPGSGRQLAAHLERFDPSWDGTGVAPVVSIEQLRAPTRPEPQRLANLAANPALRPIATDATISVEWSVPINDTLGLAAGIATGAGDQLSGDLALRYDLVRIAVRRRARFGDDRAWKDLDDRIELVADFSDPGGVQLGGEFAAQVLSATWDVDLRADGGPVAKKLLVNAVAPYEFATADAELDEQLIHRLPSWPCCAPLDDKTLHDLFHRVSWRDRLVGAALGMPASSRFSDSSSTLRFPRPAWTHAAGFSGLPVGTVVSAAEIVQPGVVARADLDEDAAFCSVRVAWPRGALLTVVAFDGAGKEVARRELGSGSAAFVTTLFGAQGPIRRLEIRTFRPPSPGAIGLAATSSVGTLVEVDEVTYIGLRDYLDLLRAQAACGDGGGHGGYEGRGKLGLLPNHEYELRFTTRVTVAHPSVPEESADVDEFVYVRTKGLPGLNAVERVGEEIEPYVRGAYAGGRAGLVYRTEPITLAFSEDFHVAVPLAVRPPGSATEHTVLQTMQLLVTPEVALRAGTAFTATDADWIVAHPGAGIPPVRGPRTWHPRTSGSHSTATPMVSVNPARHRLAALTQRAAVTCGPADPRRVIGTVLVAPPQGGGSSDPTVPGSPELWPGGGRFLATVRAEHAPFVDRRPFDPGDETALTRSGGPWSIVDGRLEVAGSGTHIAVLGDPDWDHLSVAVSVSAQGRAGVGFGMAGASAVARGIFAEIAGTRLVVSARATAGGALVELDAADLPAATDARLLEVTAFDDRLRASVGDVVVEVDRGELRTGRMGLVADGAAAFGSLQVHGLDMYRFPFGVSRYRSFEEHLGSWNGVLAELAPDATGPGTTASTVAQLWAQTSADVAAVMAPSAPPAERERVFGAWVAGLGLALTDEVTEVRVSRFLVGNRVDALLIESPEPLDFTEEITATATRRQRTGSLPPHRHEPVGPIGTVRERVVHAALRPLEPGRARRPGIDDTILDADVVGDALRLSLHPALADAGVLPAVAIDDAGNAQLFRGRVRPGLTPTSPAILPAAHVGPLPALPPHSELAPLLHGAPPGTILLASADLLVLLGRHRLQPGEIDVDVPVEVIQSGDGRRALVVSATGEPFATGTHRMTFRLVRRRWDTTDPADELNTYSAEASWHLAL